MKPVSGVCGVLLAISALVQADGGQFDKSDVASPDALTRALHEWATTAAEERLSYDDLFFLMHPDSVAIFIRPGIDGATVEVERRLLKDWLAGLDRANPRAWLETIVDLDVEQQGYVANVWAQYEVRDVTGGPIIKKGITNLQLFYDGDRWWGLGWTDTPISNADSTGPR